MFKKFLSLEWKAFLRSAAFTGNIVITIFKILGALYFIALFLILGFLLYPGLEKSGVNPIVLVNKYIIYYVVVDLIFKLLLQKIPVINVKPLLTLPIKRSTVVNFAISKTLVSFFNIIHLFFLVPFTISLMINGDDAVSGLLWFFSIFMFIYCSNFLNLLLDSKTNLLIGFAVIVATIAGLQYYEFFDVTDYTGAFFQSSYDSKYMVALPVVLLAILWVLTFKYFQNHLRLDAGLSKKQVEARTENLSWLERYGFVGTFLKNDIRMIKRNKRPRSSVIMSFLFVFYGIIFYSGAIEAYDNAHMHMFAAIFVTGGFLFTFGQFVPSWDSSYYPLMMCQNIKYKEYISAKWWLVVIGTIVSTILASFYLYFSVDIYLMIIAAGVYNLGVNSHLVLLGGAYIKTPIDLGSAKQAFGNKKAFNVKTLIITLPKMIVPMVLYTLGEKLIGHNWGVILVVAAGVLGFAFRNLVFRMIERIYTSEKYATLHSYKQKN